MVGLLEPLVWNETTGNLVGGHQRLAAIDALEGSENYYLDVSAVQLSDVAEREQNIALNNPSLQGDWDEALIGEMLRTDGFNLERTGWDASDLGVLFDDESLSKLFAPSEAEAALLAEIAAVHSDAEVGAVTGAKSIKDAREKMRAIAAVAAAQSNSEAYTIVLFSSVEQREAFMLKLGLAADDRYVDGERLATKMGE